MILMPLRYAVPILWILVLEAIGGGIGIMTSANIDNWYADLNRSPLNPPGWVFGIVWPVLYALIAMAGWRIWSRRQQPPMRTLWFLFILQMLMNWAWSFLFFGAHLLWPSFLWITVLVIIVSTLIVKAWQQERVSTYLLAPYLAWISFATYLTLHVALFN